MSYGHSTNLTRTTPTCREKPQMPPAKAFSRTTNVKYPTASIHPVSTAMNFGDAKFVRTYKYKMHKRSTSVPDALKSTQTATRKPALNNSSGRMKYNLRTRFANGRLHPDDPLRDLLGGSGVELPETTGQSFRDVCLITSLRNLGVPLKYSKDGPFRALSDGNPMLGPFGKRLVRVDDGQHIGVGSYVVHHRNHFLAVSVDSRVTVKDSMATEFYATVEAAGRSTDQTWFRLEDVAEASLPASYLAPVGREAMDQLWAESMRREALRRERAESPSSAHLTEEQRRLVERRRAEAVRVRASVLVRPIPPLTWTQPVVPTKPDDFLTWDRVLPDVSFLRHLNAHPRDRHVQFFPDRHKYLVRGKETLGSVTGLIHAYTNPFDADHVIDRMMRGSRWPRPGYLQNNFNKEDMHTLTCLPPAADLLLHMKDRARNEEAICNAARILRDESPTIRWIVNRLALNASQIKRKWADHRDEAANAGTWMHFTFECWLNRVTVDEDTDEMKLLLKFAWSLRGLRALRTEWQIYGDEERLAGSIDFVASNEQGGLVLFDWTRSKTLRSKYVNVFQKMLPPLQHVDDCLGMHYRIQLNAYRYILQKYYGHRVDGMFVVCTHPDNGSTAFVDTVPVMYDEVESMMEEQRQRVHEMASMSAADSIELDPLGGSADNEWDLDRAIEEESAVLEEEFGESLAVSQALVLSRPATPMRPIVNEGHSTSCTVGSAASAGGAGTAPMIAGRTYSADSPERALPSASCGAAVVGVAQDALVVPSIVAVKREPRDVEPTVDLLDLTATPPDELVSKRRRLIKGASESSSKFDELFRSCEGLADVCIARASKEVIPNEDSILQQTRRLRKLVKERFPCWSRHLVGLATGALAIYRLRLVDMFRREYALLLWLIEGDDYLRAHDGAAYLYHNDGAFVAYRGIPPESTFGRVKAYLLRLEGLFRLLPRDVKRVDEDLLNAFNACLNSFATVDNFYRRCEEAAIFNLGDRRRVVERGSGRRSDDADTYADEESATTDAPMHWPSHTATALSKVGLQLQKELLDERVITYIIEWCETPDERAPGVAYTDTCVLYDHEGQNAVHAKKGPSNNIYLRIPHSLMDPVEASHRDRLLTFISQTFWANSDAYACCQAAQALARRGLNVDRCFIGISPGGVGQSLYSSFLAAMYGHNHAFFDPNIWYDDQESR